MFLAQHHCCINVYAFYCCLSLTFMYCCSLGFSRIIFNPTDKGTRHPSVYQKTLSVPVSFLYFSSKIMLGMIHWQTPITSLLCLLPLLNNFYSAFTKSRMRSDQVLFHIPHSKQLHFYEFLECFDCLIVYVISSAVFEWAWAKEPVFNPKFTMKRLHSIIQLCYFFCFLTLFEADIVI